jgi:DNA-binding YbaB/EbfC family protein
MSTNDDQPIQGEVVPADAADADDPLAGLLGGPGGGIDLGSMMEMAANMQQQMADAQQRLGDERVDGTAGGGLVTVTLNGHLHLVGVSISPDAVDPDDLSMLEDLIRAAWQDAHDQVARLQAAADPLGGLGGAGGLGDLFGGA